MTEEEIMIRAREAAIAVAPAYQNPYSCIDTRKGILDGHAIIRAAAYALRDLSKPLAEIQPVDPDLIEARKIATANTRSRIVDYLAGQGDNDAPVMCALAAIKRGRELEKAKG